ncbi:MAG TPA: flagellar basal-body rod protein FlgG, partial [Gemmatimonadaceae bacterium]|nr:flagellar basal-body rod protein FlgG [Gemmatimonadaceae bacterium]
AATGMQAQQTRTDVIANNLANVNTTGFKRSRAHFEDLLYQTLQGPATLGSRDTEQLPAIQVGLGTRLTAVQRIDSQGSLEQTSRPLDLAIQGEGYFEVQMPNGNTAYTRDGSLQVSDQGVLVTGQGYAIQPPIRVPKEATSITVSETGVVTANGLTSAAGGTQELGRIELARFPNSSGLESMGQNLFTETTSSGEPIRGMPTENGNGSIAQGYLESSNVEIVTEMVDMITAQRAYEINSKAIKNSEDMAQTANSLMR